MNEEMKESEKLLVIENEMKGFAKLLGAASDKIISSQASSFPIFVVSKQPIALGINLIDREKVNSNWSINASSFEELVSKKLIFENKTADFQRTFKDPNEYICLFVLSDLGAQYMFIPRIVD